MKKYLPIALIIAIIVLVAIGLGIVKFKWLAVDMGWCKRYHSGMKILEHVIFQLPDGPSTCV